MVTLNASIRVQNGGEAGRTFPVSADGIRIGRSEKNDVVLPDPLLSRYHCRLFIKDGGLWITDLGSANETLLDGNAISEAPAYKGALITIGDTVLSVVDDGRDGNQTVKKTSSLFKKHSGSISSRFPARDAVWIAAGVSFLLLASAITWMLMMRSSGDEVSAPSTMVVTDQAHQETDSASLTLAYEKIEADANNIFRYTLDIEPSGIMRITVHDIGSNRRLQREKEIDSNVIEDVATRIRQSRFDTFEPVYRGIAPGQLEERHLKVILDGHAHAVRVVNSRPPERFDLLCRQLENIGKVELGLWAMQYSAAQLQEMAEEALLQGKKLGSEREIAPGNLARAIQHLNEAEWLLESLEQKPGFFDEILSTRQAYEESLRERYEQINFRAERALRLRDWEQAAEELRLLLDVIPDREDERHRSARAQLIEVDHRRGRNR